MNFISSVFYKFIVVVTLKWCLMLKFTSIMDQLKKIEKYFAFILWNWTPFHLYPCVLCHLFHPYPS